MKAVIFRFDERGDPDFHISADVRVFVVDERAPNDRVYEVTRRATEAEVAAIIGDSEIHSANDARHPAIEARILDHLGLKPRLAVVPPEGDGA